MVRPGALPAPPLSRKCSVTLSWLVRIAAASPFLPLRLV